MTTINTHELAWAAGFFDGEGHIRTTTPAKFKQLVATIGHTDLELLRRFQKAVLGLGNITGPYIRDSQYKNVYSWRTSNFEHGQAIISLLWKFLGNYRKEQALQALEEMKEDFKLPRMSTKDRAQLALVSRECNRHWATGCIRDSVIQLYGETKQCSCCEIVKPIEEFSLRSGDRGDMGHLRSACRQCGTTYIKKYKNTGGVLRL